MIMIQSRNISTGKVVIIFYSEIKFFISKIGPGDIRAVHTLCQNRYKPRKKMTEMNTGPGLNRF
jgi:hypothetical protein